VDILDHFENGDLVWTLERHDEKGQLVFVIHGRCHLQSKDTKGDR
jgi:hypothetical protein